MAKSGLVSLYTNTVAIHNSTVFAGTSGAWQRPLSLMLGINEPQSAEESYSLYPNPANCCLEIEKSTDGKQLMQVFDISGNLVLSTIISNKKNTVDVSGLPVGEFTVSFSGKYKVNNKKLLIVR